MTGKIETRLKEMGETLPHAPAAVGSYIPALQTGNLVCTSGQLPTVGKELMFKGKVGLDLGPEEAQNAARICILNCLAQVKQITKTLDDIKRIVRVEGFVQSDHDFYDQPAVLNAASNLLVELFGPDIGKHTRFAVGAHTLPLNAAVEIALWVEV